MERRRIDYKYPELVKRGVFLARIPIEIKNFENAIREFNENDKYKENVEFRAKQIAEDVGLGTETSVIFDDRGLVSVTVAPFQCSCIGIKADDWESRDVQYPAFSTHNVDTPLQYLALTSTVFHYLNVLEAIAKSQNAH